jgi:hypothetical protein
MCYVTTEVTNAVQSDVDAEDPIERWPEGIFLCFNEMK